MMNLDIPSPFLIFNFNDGSCTKDTVFSNPERIIQADSIQNVLPALHEVERAVKSGFYAAGYISYEAAPAFDSAFVVSNTHTIPLLWFGIFDKAIEKQPCHTGNHSSKNKFTFTQWKPNITKDRYESQISAIKHAISYGKTYQVNHTLRFHSKFDGDDFAFYNEKNNSHPSRYAAYLNLPRHRIISFSPELFFQTQGNQIMTRPMKGTVNRGRWFEEDEAHASWLAASVKNQAENVMIVDLLRNDLGRIAEVGTVHVRNLFQIERYPTVFQMTSTIGATIKPMVTLPDIFRALFPCGSITGAPKVSTMRFISDLEESPRDIYCGTIGFIKPNGDAIFNVAIRTMFIDSATGAAIYGAGGGITFDSAANSEFEEVFMKTAVLTDEQPQFQLLETLKLENNQYALFHHHLRRLVNSAKYFDFPVEISSIERALYKHRDQYKDTVRKVRLLIYQDGQIYVESSPLVSIGSEARIFAIANTPVSSSNRFLYHKTTYRHIFDQHRAEHNNVFDILLWNENHEITEFTTGNVVLEIDGQKRTPKISCGLLPGTFRSHLLETNEVSEAILTLSDLKRAEKIWYINSVRGWIPVYLEPGT